MELPLVTSTEMFKKAYEGHYAVGAFNVNNMEIIQGIVSAAQELKAPLILQVCQRTRLGKAADCAALGSWRGF